jgi:hypothetical protein
MDENALYPNSFSCDVVPEARSYHILNFVCIHWEGVVLLAISD